MSEISSTSELTTKEIVEQAISDYHESILPYLNGQVPTIANKFDKANLYSEDEQIVGRWIDGKPLYQKTWTGLNVDIAYNSWTPIISISNDIDIYIIANILSTNYVVDMGGSGIEFKREDGVLYGEYNQNLNRRPVGMITLQYTKTTDTSIAIGSDTDYSTTEKIIGTWIDGKPLYQKTIDCGAMPNNTDKTITHGISNIDTIFPIEGFSISSSKDFTFISSVDPANSNYSIGAWGNVTAITIRTRADYSAYNGYMTLRYTKTTD